MDIFKILHYNISDLNFIFTFFKNMSFLELLLYIGFLCILVVFIKKSNAIDDDSTEE